MEQNKSYKSGIAALVGKTNVGKSTLLNSLIDEKVTIVSNRAQTTRNLIRAILTTEQSQIVFLDTPGIHYAVGELGKKMNKISRNTVTNVDVIILVLDLSTMPDEIDEGWFKRLIKLDKPLIFVCNKVDVGDQNVSYYKKIWKMLELKYESTKVSYWVNVSALKKRGLTELQEKINNIIPFGPKLFPEDVLTDYPIKLYISDVIREKLIIKLHKELPHSIAVWVDEYAKKDDIVNINAFIYVERHSQKGIVIGNKGNLIKQARLDAEYELNKTYQNKHNVTLKVKVEKNWRKNFWIMKKLGYS